MNTPDTSIPEDFWSQIDHQLQRIAALEPAQPDAFDAVRSILLDPAYTEIQRQNNLNGTRTFDADTAFFAGSGGDALLADALFKAGWRTIAVAAPYHYCKRHTVTEELLSYTEGDVQRGNTLQP